MRFFSRKRDQATQGVLSLPSPVSSYAVLASMLACVPTVEAGRYYGRYEDSSFPSIGDLFCIGLGLYFSYKFSVSVMHVMSETLYPPRRNPIVRIVIEESSDEDSENEEEDLRVPIVPVKPIAVNTAPTSESRFVKLLTELTELLKRRISKKVIKDIEQLERKMTDFYEENKCPISRCLYENPVTVTSGFTYEKKAIEDWLLVNKTCPVTRYPLLEKHGNHLYINMFRRDQITKQLSEWEKVVAGLMAKYKMTKDTEVAPLPCTRSARRR